MYNIYIYVYIYIYTPKTSKLHSFSGLLCPIRFAAPLHLTTEGSVAWQILQLFDVLLG